MKSNKSTPKPAPDQPDQPPTPPRRRWLFRLVSLMLVPLVLLGGTELGLRLAGYGYSTSFFKHTQLGGEEYLVENDKFGLRFFPPQIARSPAPVKLKAHKPPGTYRIFLFGESAALGDPRPAFGAGRYLQVLLNERFPNTKFEVVCVAMTAINSHAILPIARECSRLDGDLWLIYMGNNEMIGPFGATTVLGQRAPPLILARWNLALQTTRVGQLLMNLGRKLKRGAPADWTGMTLFVNSRVRPDDPHNEIIYRNFSGNLEDILCEGVRRKAAILLNTVAVNLKDSPPFASVSRTDLTADQRSAWQASTADGFAAQTRGDLAGAAEYYERAAKLDPLYAETQFQLGRCQLGLTNYASAAEHFSRARDLDALPFRTSTRLNDLTMQVFQNFKGPGAVLFDATRFFATNSPAGIPGKEWFYEHVHFNFDGNYQLGRAWAEQVAKLLPENTRNGGTAEWASQQTCDERLGLSDWNRASVLEDMLVRLKQPPLSTQSDNAHRLEVYAQVLRELRTRLTRPAAEQARAMYLAAIGLAPDDHRLHENFAEFLEAIGQIPSATEQWQRVRDLIPHHHVAWFQTGRLLARQGKLDEAQAALEQALTLRPDLSEGWLELGKLHAVEGKQELALSEYERARALEPRDYRVHYHMGKALSKLGRGPQAIAEFHQAVRLRPDDWEAIYALGEELAFAGRTPEAHRRFQEVIRLKPNHAMAHLNLGVALVQEGRLDEAAQQFQETLKLDPQNQRARDYLDQLARSQK